MNKLERQDEPKELQFPTILEIYKKSIIDWNDFYESMTVMEVKTGNSHKDIMKMQFYEFMIKIKYLNKYIEAENKSANGESPNEEHEKMLQGSKSMFNSATSGFKIPKAPSMPKFK